MPDHAQPLLPLPGERGLSSGEPDHLRGLVSAAWDDFLELAEGVDLTAPTRCQGWDGRALLAHLGLWEGAVGLAGAVDEARTGLPVDPDAAYESNDARNARVVAAHGDASREELLVALTRSRAEVLRVLDDPEAQSLATVEVPSAIGPLPLLGVAATIGYELAVHARDLVPSGAPAELTLALANAGLAALADATGALAARSRLTTTFALATDAAVWVSGVVGPDWTTISVVEADPGWAAVEGQAATVLDASAGRVAVPPLLVTRELRTRHVPALLELAPILENVPGLPGGPALRTAARYLAGVGRLARWVPGLR